MLATDHRLTWDDILLTDDRVIHFWDQERETGSWYAEQGFYPFGRIAWDIFFLYGPEATWKDIPTPLIQTGFTIINRSTDLREAIMPLLE